MKIPGVDFDFQAPSEHGVDPISSARNVIYMELLPFLAGYFVFVVLWMILLWDLWDALAPTSTVWGLGYILFFRWRDKIRAEAQTLDAVNLLIRWREGVHIPESNVITEIKVLEEPSEVDLKKAENPENTEEVGSLLYLSEVSFVRPFKNPETEDFYSEAIFIHHGPKDRTFGKVPNQWIYHKGQMLPGSAVVLDVDFVGYKTELEHKPAFHVKADPYSTRLNQRGLGLTPQIDDEGEPSLTPRTTDKPTVKKALDLSSTREALKLKLELREVRAENVELKKGHLDGVERSHKNLGRVLRDVEVITRPGKPLRERVKGRWKDIVKVIVVVAVIYGIAWYLNIV